MTGYTLTSGDGTQSRVFLVLSQDDAMVHCQVSYPGDPSIPANYVEFQDFDPADFTTQVVSVGVESTV